MSDKIKKLKAVRQIEIVKLEELFKSAIDAEKDKANLPIFKARFEDIDAIRDEFDRQHTSLVTSLVNEDETVISTETQVLKDFTKQYFHIKAIYAQLNAGELQHATKPNSINPDHFNMPKLELIKFKGDIKAHSSFWDMFRPMVHNNNKYSPSEKLTYLFSCLEGTALNIVKHLKICDNNYEVAIKLLNNRFSNPRQLCQAHWSAIESAPRSVDNDPVSLRNLLDIFCENLEALNSLDYPVQAWDFILANKLLSKMDNTSTTLFEITLDSDKNMPSYKQIYAFLEKHCNRLCTLKHVNNVEKPKRQYNGNKQPHIKTSLLTPATFFTTNNSSSNQSCLFCKQNHPLFRCNDFINKTPHDRFNFAKQHNLCVNCLSSTHKFSQCNSFKSCRVCYKKHHSLLHLPSRSEVVEREINTTNNLAGPSTLDTQNFPHSLSAVSKSNLNSQSVLLATALVNVYDNSGNLRTVRALLDTGSQATIITKNCASRLKLPRTTIDSIIQGIGDTHSAACASMSLTISATRDKNYKFNVDALILNNICAELPTSQILTDSWDHIKFLPLADPQFGKPGPIDLLLGADVFPRIIQTGQVIGDTNEPIAINTIFGYVIMGKYQSNLPPTVRSFFCKYNCEQLNSTLKKFWEIENIPTKTFMSPEDTLCEQKYLNSVTRNIDGRFVVALPFKTEEPNFKFSKELALKRFYSLETRLLRDRDLYNTYNQFLLEYLELGHMEKVSSSDYSHKGFYIPHLYVSKPDSISTKLRVVFNASAKQGNNLSLNDTLLVGPKLQKNIGSILIRFRLHNVVLTADIKKMYRQILIVDKHQDYQKIFWRFSPNDVVSEFRLKTVTYGVSSAPYLALRTIQRLAEEEKDLFPRAANILLSDTYVDDICTGCSSLSEAITLKQELTNLLKSAGFELHKWSSNLAELVDEFLPSDSGSNNISFDHDKITKVLGLHWQPLSDSFSYNVQSDDITCTKRHMLSELARIFDPLGFLAPITFFSKRLIQKLWVLGLSWDQTPPIDILNLWEKFKNDLPLLSTFRLPRHIDIDNYKSCQLHGFSDASLAGYAAVVYLRVEKGSQVFTYFVTAKSRLCPLKTLSIPRLELISTVLLSDLMSYVHNTLQDNINISNVFAWSDSSIALSWLKSHPHKWQTFVSNRVSYVQDKIPPDRWFHIKSQLNPADIASRGALPAELINNTSWWAGPDFLKLPPNLWPVSHVCSLDTQEISKEKRKNVILTVTKPADIQEILINKFSKLNTLLRVTAYLLRFIQNCKTPSNKKLTPFAFRELNVALMFLIKYEQFMHFQDVIKKLNRSARLPKPLQKLSLFIDSEGILRVGGRLHNSPFSFDKKHPALLHKNSKLTTSIIENIHLKYLHAGVQTVQYFLYQNFWILSAKRTIQSVLSRCVKCFRVKPKTFAPFMGNLPKERIIQNKPFSHSGVDYAGPFSITLSKIRGSKTMKAYICLFICFATKAIHLELCSDLTSDAFLAALRRFVARRGHISHLYSDNGTNFVKANKELISLIKQSASQELIEWNFLPPSAPHFGGLWEAGVKAVKTHLIRVIGAQILTYEEFLTVLCQVEAILNSRPISPMSNDPNDLNVLSPGHFLTLAPLTCAPDVDLSDINPNRLSRWQLLQKMQQDFWKRWHLEYLHTLQQRHKWSHPEASPITGDLVLIKDDTTPPLQWRIARIISIHPGPDGVVRVATVKTAGGVLKRPLIKLCPLPI